VSCVRVHLRDHRVSFQILYEGMQVELPFAAFFLCKLLRHKNSDVDINHLQSFDPDFYRLVKFLRCPAQFCLNVFCEDLQRLLF